jgi:hypothetical protein
MRLGPNSDEWRPYFAWHPIKVGNRLRGGTVTVWLEWLERKEAGCWEGAHVWSKWTYRFPVANKRS